MLRFSPILFLSAIVFLSLSAILPADTNLSRPGKDYALFFAVEDYRHWNNLNNPISDAEAIAAELKTKYGFTIEIVRNPSKTEIYDKLERYTQRSYASDAQLLIFFTGHGHFRETTKQGYFIPKGGRSPYDDRFGESYLSHSILNDVVSVIPCPHILLAIDACYSGTFDRAIALGKEFGKRPGANSGGLAAWVRESMQYNSRLYLTSGGKQRTSDGVDYSPFTKSMLNALRSYGGRDNDGILSFSELQSYMQTITPIPRSGEFEGHEPGGNFFFIREDAAKEKLPRDPDGNVYPVKKFAGLTWTTQNLNYPIPGESWCYEDNSANCEKYGRLYTWEAAKRACRELGNGWRLPTDQEWRDLAKRFGGADDDASDDGKAAYQAMIDGGNSGFSARLGGYRYSNGSFFYLGGYGLYWSATEYGSVSAWYYLFYRDSGKLFRNWDAKSFGHSCRCVQGS